LPSLLCYFQIAIVESSFQFYTYLFFICVCNIILPRNNLELLRGYIYHTIILHQNDTSHYIPSSLWAFMLWFYQLQTFMACWLGSILVQIWTNHFFLGLCMFISFITQACEFIVISSHNSHTLFHYVGYETCFGFTFSCKTKNQQFLPLISFDKL
jgi:hypothetical protein